MNILQSFTNVALAGTIFFGSMVTTGCAADSMMKQEKPAFNDLEIAHIAYTAGALDIRYAHLALALSDNPEVKKFAELIGKTLNCQSGYEISKYEKKYGKPNIVFSASGSQKAHFIAAKYSAKNNIPWIADYGDPWYSIEKKNRPYLAKIVKSIEANLVSKASKLIFTTNATKKEYIDKYNILASKCNVIPYGFLAKDTLVEEKKINNTENQIITYSHIGTAHKNDRNLIPFILALDEYQLEKKSKFGMLIAGKHSPDFDVFLNKSKIHKKNIYNLISLEHSVKLHLECDISIIVGNKNGAQVPGKIFVCLAIPRPILYIAQTNQDNDEAYSFLKDTGGIIYCNSNDVQSIKLSLRFISLNYNLLQKKSYERVESEIVNKFEGKNLSNHLKNLINELSN